MMNGSLCRQLDHKKLVLPTFQLDALVLLRGRQQDKFLVIKLSTKRTYHHSCIVIFIHFTVPNAPEGFSYQPTTFSSAEVTFLWNATEGPVLLACRKNDNTVPTIIREFCGCCSPVNVTEFTHSSEYTCSLSKRNGVVVGPSSTITFTTDADSKSTKVCRFRFQLDKNTWAV